jgi:hypothetical protein
MSAADYTLVVIYVAAFLIGGRYVGAAVGSTDEDLSSLMG